MDEIQKNKERFLLLRYFRNLSNDAKEMVFIYSMFNDHDTIIKQAEEFEKFYRL